MRLILAILAASPAAAQQNCATRDAMLARLEGEYSETRQSLGIAANGALMETWANDETGTWTVTVSSPSGLMCMIASGESWVLAVSKPKGDPL